MTSLRTKNPAGVGLVDLMVGLAIGLIAMLVILHVAINFESRRRSTTGIADAQLNAASAMLLMAREIRIAGQGLGPPDSLGCSILHDEVNLGTLSLQPVEIINGNNGRPDRVSILASGSPQIISPATLIADHSATDSTMLLDTTLGIERQHRLLLYEPGKSCALLTATSIPLGGYRVNHLSMPSPVALAHASGSRVVNLGRLHYLVFAVDGRDYLQVNRYIAASDQWQSAAMASEVVNLQAQYGFDTQPGTPSGTLVTRWSDTMFDANGNGITGDNADLRRLIAIRLAIVVRSAERSNEGCNASTVQWMAGDDVNGQLQQTPIYLGHISDWRCFRYRVLQTEIPLRNLLWSDT